MLVLVLVLMAAVPVFADTGLQEGGSAIIITKRLLVAPGLTVPDGTFEFVVTPQETEGVTAPDINSENKVTLTTTASDPLSVPETGTNGYYFKDYSVTVIPEDVDVDTIFSHAGIYVYTVAETPNTFTLGSNPTMTYSDLTYQMTVYVANTSSGDLEITDVGFRLYANNTAGEKADPVFTNIYAKAVPFTVSKTVLHASGNNYADLTKEFSYSLGMTIPGADAATYTGVIYDKDGDATGDTVTLTFDGSSVPNTASNVTFTLSHGETLVFDGNNGSTLLPLGATYTITETGTTGYTPSVDLTSGAQVAGTTEITFDPTPAAAGSSITVTKALLVDDDNAADFTNTYKTVTPTGILMDNLPFVLLILVACGGLVAYLVLKRRKAHNR